jgi:REP element-mobilizing transposase RayT
MGYFKMNSAKAINAQRTSLGVHVWQRSYHDRIIRSDRELQAIRQYIRNNPKKWEEDEYACV